VADEKCEQGAQMNMRYLSLLVFVSLAVSAVTGCSGKKTATVTLAGSTAFQPFAEQLAEKFMQINPAVRVTVQGGGSIVGIQAVQQGAADIGMADLLTLPEEVTKTLAHRVVARDGLAIIVHPSNPVDSISLEQAQEIFCGTITNWKALGGPDARIDIVSREEGSGTRKSFECLVLKEKALTTTALFQDSNGTIREAVATNPNAIGYLSIGFLDRRVKALKLNGVAPTNENVIKGTYPLSRPIFFVYRDPPSPAVESFVSFVVSPEGERIIAEKGLIPVQSK